MPEMSLWLARMQIYKEMEMEMEMGTMIYLNEIKTIKSYKSLSILDKLIQRTIHLGDLNFRLASRGINKMTLFKTIDSFNITKILKHLSNLVILLNRLIIMLITLILKVIRCLQLTHYFKTLIQDYDKKDKQTIFLLNSILCLMIIKAKTYSQRTP